MLFWRALVKKTLASRGQVSSHWSSHLFQAEGRSCCAGGSCHVVSCSKSWAWFRWGLKTWPAGLPLGDASPRQLLAFQGAGAAQLLVLTLTLWHAVLHARRSSISTACRALHPWMASKTAAFGSLKQAQHTLAPFSVGLHCENQSCANALTGICARFLLLFVKLCSNGWPKDVPDPLHLSHFSE